MLDRHQGRCAIVKTRHWVFVMAGKEMTRTEACDSH